VVGADETGVSAKITHDQISPNQVKHGMTSFVTYFFILLKSIYFFEENHK